MITDKTYLSNTAVSQSKLKKILGHPRQFLEPGFSDEDETPEAITVGDGVDLLITQGEDAFENKFYIATVERPTAQMGDFVWNLFINRHNSNAAEIAYRTVGFKRDTLEKVKERFKTEGKPYYKQLLEAEGKDLITPSQFNTIQLIKKSLLENRYTAKFLKNSDRFLISFQVMVTFEYEDTPCKGLLDVLCYDRLENKLYPIDIKTTGTSINTWMFTFFKHRYDFQAAFYRYGLGSTDLTQFCEGNVPILQPFRFIVENQKFPGNPLIYEVTDETLNIGQFGGEVDGRYYEGFRMAIIRYKWHISNDLWDYRMEDYENEGVRYI
jgi:hypothetical protein